MRLTKARVRRATKHTDVDLGQLPKCIKSDIALWARYLMQRKSTSSDFERVCPTIQHMDIALNALAQMEVKDVGEGEPLALPDDTILAARRIAEPTMGAIDKLRLDDNFQAWTADRHRRWGISAFLYNWDGSQDDRYNQLLFAFFLRTFDFVARAGQLSHGTMLTLAKLGNDYTVIMAQTQKHFDYLAHERRKWLRDPDSTKRAQDSNRATKLRGAKRERRSEFAELLRLDEYLMAPAIKAALTSKDFASDTEEQIDDNGNAVHISMTPAYRSHTANRFLDDLETYGRAIKSRGILQRGRAGRGPQYTQWKRKTGDPVTGGTIPRNLPVDFYDEAWLASLSSAERQALMPNARSCPEGQDVLAFIMNRYAESTRRLSHQVLNNESSSCGSSRDNSPQQAEDDVPRGSPSAGKNQRDGLGMLASERIIQEMHESMHMDIDDSSYGLEALRPTAFGSQHSYPPLSRIKQESDSGEL